MRRREKCAAAIGAFMSLAYLVPEMTDVILSEITEVPSCMDDAKD